MKIISKFHDFYDVGMGLGFDPDVKYIRKEEVVKDEIHRYEINKFYSDGQLLIPYHVGFCGSWYRCIEWLDDYYYDYDKLATAFDTLGCKMLTRGWTDRWNDVECFLKNTKVTTVARHEPRIKSKAEKRREIHKAKSKSVHDRYGHYYSRVQPTLFQVYRSPIVVTNYYRSHITINCNLAKYQFYKVMDPYSAYQKLYQWFGSQAAPEKPIPKISNEDMIQAKGFDLKTSFRKEKQK